MRPFRCQGRAAGAVDDPARPLFNRRVGQSNGPKRLPVHDSGRMVADYGTTVSRPPFKEVLHGNGRLDVGVWAR